MRRFFSLFREQTSTLRLRPVHRNWEIFWIFFSKRNCAPMLNVFVCFFIGSECRCLFWVAIGCEKDRMYARLRALLTTWNMTKVSIQSVLRYICNVCTAQSVVSRWTRSFRLSGANSRNRFFMDLSFKFTRYMSILKGNRRGSFQ